MKTLLASLLLPVFKRFFGDESGNYAVVFALAITPVVGFSALSIEYSQAYEARTHLQNALDAAALAAAKELPRSRDDERLALYSEDFFYANLHPKMKPGHTDFKFGFGEGLNGGRTILLEATYDQKTTFGRIFDVEEFNLEVRSEVVVGNKTIEVAIVIDNSGSMSSGTAGTSDTRLENAKTAASDLVEELFTIAGLSNKADPVQVSVVPFAGSVNIGPQHDRKWWTDRKGWSSIHHENLDWAGHGSGEAWPGVIEAPNGYYVQSRRQVGGTRREPRSWLTRWTLFDELDVEWKGCVEMRPWPYHVTDAEPTNEDPDTLFVPMFAPDEPDEIEYYGFEDRDYTRSGNNYLADFVRPGSNYSITRDNTGDNDSQLARLPWIAKYNEDAMEYDWLARNNEAGTSASRDYGDYGPNFNCTTEPLIPLSKNKQAVLDTIETMEPGGFTNVQAGLAWGWRTLSPGVPFTGGREYDAVQNHKYIIVLTDGANTYPGQNTLNDTQYYSWGYGRQERVKDGLLQNMSNAEAMDVHLAQTCNNIKAERNVDGDEAITIFTIAYDVPRSSSIKGLLEGCASTSAEGKRYYYDVSGTALADAMQEIGSEISKLRIAN